MKPVRYLVTAAHPAPEFALKRSTVMVYGDERTGYSASCRPHGCGREYPEPQQAIRELLLANGCRDIVVDEPEIEFIDPVTGHEN